MCSETSCVATFGEFGVELLKSAAVMAFVKFTCKQSPTFARSTIGRGRLCGRSWKVFGTRSCLSAKTNALGIVAPRRLSIMAFGIATTSALTVRVHVSIGATGAAAVASVAIGPVVVVAAVGTGAVVPAAEVGSDFGGPVSVLGGS